MTELKTTANLSKSATEPSRNRILAVTMEGWIVRGAAGMSARQLSQAADAPVSSIYHHFGSLEHLFLSSQSACLAAAREWCEHQIAQLDGIAAPPEFSGFFAHIVDEWTQAQPALAFAWRECLLLANRSPLFEEPARQWLALWERFWRQAGDIFGLGADVIVAERVFETESLYHLIRWRRLIDRAALDETARGLAAWLSGAPVPASPWREFAHAEATRRLPVSAARDPATAQLMTAAGGLVAERGVAGVTHRAVAERAGLTLGTVSHKFPTKAALLEAAFEGIYAAMVTEAADSSGRSRPAATREETIADLTLAVVGSTQGAGRDELFLAAARDPTLADFGAQLRYLRGRSSRASIQAIIGPHRTASLLETALFSAFISSQLRAHALQPSSGASHRAQKELVVLSDVVAAAHIGTTREDHRGNAARPS